jgi:hypothetical protein
MSQEAIMKIIGTLSHGYLVELTVHELNTLAGRSLPHLSGLYGGNLPNPSMIGNEYPIQGVVARISEVLNAKEKLDRAAKELAGLALICENIDLAVPTLPERPEQEPKS